MVWVPLRGCLGKKKKYHWQIAVGTQFRSGPRSGHVHMTHSPSLPTSTLARMSTNSFLRHRVKAKSATTRNQTNLLWRVANFREKNNPFMSRIPHKHPDGQIKCHNEFSLCCVVNVRMSRDSTTIYGIIYNVEQWHRILALENPLAACTTKAMTKIFGCLASILTLHCAHFCKSKHLFHMSMLHFDHSLNLLTAY